LFGHATGFDSDCFTVNDNFGFVLSAGTFFYLQFFILFFFVLLLKGNQALMQRAQSLPELAKNKKGEPKARLQITS